MLDLEQGIRELIDGAAPPVTMEELAVGRAPRPPRRRLAVGVAAAVALVALGAAVLVAGRDDSSRPRVSVPASTTAPSVGVTPDCTATTTGFSGCLRTRVDAERILGIPLRTPAVRPHGWRRVDHSVVVYPPHFQGEANDTEVRVYRQTWTPPGTDLLHDPTPLLLMIRQRAVLPGESNDECRQYVAGHTQLADGTVVCGSIPPIPGGYGDKLVDGGELHWVKDGVMYQVRDVGLPNDVVLSVLNSLR